MGLKYSKNLKTMTAKERKKLHDANYKKAAELKAKKELSFKERNLLNILTKKLRKKDVKK